MATPRVIAARGPTWAPTGGPGRGRGAGSRRAHASGAVRWALRRPAPPAGEDARDADGGRRTTGAACPARRGTGARRRRPGSGAAVRGSRGGPSSRTRPPPRGRQRSCITPLAKTPENGETRPCAHSRGRGLRERRTRVWGPPVGPSFVHEARSVGRVARAAQHAGVGESNGAPPAKRGDVVDRQVTRRVRRMLGPSPGQTSPCWPTWRAITRWTGEPIAGPHGRDGWHRCPTGADARRSVQSIGS